MTRSIWKGPHVDSSLLSKIIKIKKIDSKKKINTWSRRSVVLPQFIGLSFNIYNGNKWVSVLITEDMIGHKLGEFAPTRKIVKHKKK
uniref:Small ribosomal subunit protein uS19c n=1 Tax=Reclinomonas americana ATCC 50283 TaxID=1295594 RepID=M4QAD0_RECAM|nr:ribosomal protein S19 [Reclinomonas americana ATCC 50283]